MENLLLSSCSSTSENFKHLFMDSFIDFLGLFFFSPPSFLFLSFHSDALSNVQHRYFSFFLFSQTEMNVLPFICLSCVHYCQNSMVTYNSRMPFFFFFWFSLYLDCTVLTAHVYRSYTSCKGIQLYFETILIFSGCIDVSRAPPLSDDK